MEVEDFLEHVGVKGMKWGVRKKRPTRVVDFQDRYTGARGQVIVPRSKGTKKEDKQIKKVIANARPSAKKLSDEQLRQAINRMQMEKQYNQLTASQKDRHPAVDFIAKHGTKIVGAAVTSVASKQVASALEGAIKKAKS